MENMNTNVSEEIKNDAATDNVAETVVKEEKTFTQDELNKIVEKSSEGKKKARN